MIGDVRKRSFRPLVGTFDTVHFNIKGVVRTACNGTDFDPLAAVQGVQVEGVARAQDAQLHTVADRVGIDETEIGFTEEGDLGSFIHAVSEIALGELAKSDVIHAPIGTTPEIEAGIAFRQADRPALLRHRNIPNLIVIANSQSDLKEEICGNIIRKFDRCAACPGITAADSLGCNRLDFFQGNFDIAAVLGNGEVRRGISFRCNGIVADDHLGERFAADCICIRLCAARKRDDRTFGQSGFLAENGLYIPSETDIDRHIDDHFLCRRGGAVLEPIIRPVRIIRHIAGFQRGCIRCGNIFERFCAQAAERPLHSEAVQDNFCCIAFLCFDRTDGDPLLTVIGIKRDILADADDTQL